MGSDGIPSKGKQLLAVLWVETFIAFTVIALRWYTRSFVGGRIGPDDYILIGSWILMAGFACLISASVHYGMGTHVQFLSTDEVVHGMLMLLIGQTFVSISMGLSKCAVAVFLMRIVNKTWHKVMLWFWIVTMMFLALFLGIAVFAQCTPVKAIWDPRVAAAEGMVCYMNLALVATIMCSWAAAMDFFLAIIPWFVIWRLNIKRKERITICVSLSLGIVAGICGVVRTTGLDALNNSADYLFAVSDSVMWTMSELTLTIICVSIPALRPLYNKIRGGSSSGGAGPYYQQSNTKGGTMNGTGNFNNTNNISSSKSGQHQYDVEIGTGLDRGADNNSDDFILHDMDKHGGGGIQRLQEVTVTYEDGLSATSTKQHV